MKRIVVVSDLHAGSFYGLLPPSFTTYEGVVKALNPGQEYLWQCWTDFTDRISHYNIDAVLVNGDVVDGPQRRSEGAELSLPAPQDQVKAAMRTLRLLQNRAGAAKWYFTQGTPYHVANFGQYEEQVASELDAQRFFSVGVGDLCREVLWLDVEGVIIEAAHHISVSTGFYRLTALDREMQWSALSAKDATKGVPKADLVIRSHVHYFSSGEHASKQGVTTPCWQLQTRYMRKASVGRMMPDIGGLIIEVDGEAKLKGEAPCRIVKELYKLPAISVTAL